MWIAALRYSSYTVVTALRAGLYNKVKMYPPYQCIDPAPMLKVKWICYQHISYDFLEHSSLPVDARLKSPRFSAMSSNFA